MKKSPPHKPTAKKPFKKDRDEGRAPADEKKRKEQQNQQQQCAKNGTVGVHGSQTTSKTAPSKRLYEMGDLVLAVGDGDLSFSLSLLRRFHPGTIFVQPTAYDSRKELLRKYPDTAPRILKELSQRFKANTQFGVDGRFLLGEEQTSRPQWRGFFSKIVFNFPHIGDEVDEPAPTGEESNQGQSQVARHQDLLREFFKSAADCLAPCGEIHVALKTGEPYKSWRIGSIAKLADCGLKTDRVVPFTEVQKELGLLGGGELSYRHRRTNGLQYEKARGFDGNKGDGEQFGVMKEGGAHVHVFVKKAKETEQSKKK
eukprot:g15975.t1